MTNVAEVQKQLNDIDGIIHEFLDKNERKMGGADDEVDYDTPVWKEYKRLINERKKISDKLAKLRGRGYT